MRIWTVVAVLGGLAAVVAGAEWLGNPGFEEPIDAGGWGNPGQLWGAATQVMVGAVGVPHQSHTGSRFLRVDIPSGSWHGAWQQVPWGADQSFSLSGYYLIQGGDLPAACATFLKAEYYDDQGRKLGEVEGDRLTQDTGGIWQLATLSGRTPPGTDALRLIVVAGGDTPGVAVTNRIFWDDLETKDR